MAMRGFQRFAAWYNPLDWFSSDPAPAPAADESAGMDLSQPAYVYTDPDGYTYSDAELQAMAADQGYSPDYQITAADYADIVETQGVIEAQAEQEGTSVAAVKAENAAVAANPAVSSLLATLGKAGAAGVAFLKANPSLVPSSIQSLIGPPVARVPGKVAAPSGISTNTMLMVGAGLIAVVLLTQRRSAP